MSVVSKNTEIFNSETANLLSIFLLYKITHYTKAISLIKLDVNWRINSLMNKIICLIHYLILLLQQIDLAKPKLECDFYFTSSGRTLNI